MPVNKKHIYGQWVEMREEATPDCIIFRSADADLPPARGRRQLDLNQAGYALAGRPGGDDRVSFGDAAIWHLKGDQLSIDAGEWKGKYKIKEADSEKLVLQPAD
jgi:hypothetical protein